MSTRHAGDSGAVSGDRGGPSAEAREAAGAATGEDGEAAPLRIG